MITATSWDSLVVKLAANNLVSGMVAFDYTRFATKAEKDKFHRFVMEKLIDRIVAAEKQLDEQYEEMKKLRKQTEEAS